MFWLKAKNSTQKQPILPRIVVSALFKLEYVEGSKRAGILSRSVLVRVAQYMYEYTGLKWRDTLRLGSAQLSIYAMQIECKQCCLYYVYCFTFSPFPW